MATLGYVTRQPDGSFTGALRTLSIRARLDILPNDGKVADGHPDYRVYAEDGVEIGAGWNRRSKASGNDYVSLSLAAPEFGPRPIYANLGHTAGSDDPDAFTLIWNPAS